MDDIKKAATISVWGKGFRVTQESEEFQRLVPRDRLHNSPTVQEAKLDAFERWPTLLQPLYAMSERELSMQRCALFQASRILVCSVGRSEDRHKRPSIVVVASSKEINWETDPVGEIVAKCHALTSRLAVAYAAAFRGSPERVLAQLRAGTFVRSEGFLLDDEIVESDSWGDVLASVREWRGITGVATPRLIALGANIVIGTQHEAETIATRDGIDGFYDVRTKAISPLSEKISKWLRPAPSMAESSLAESAADLSLIKNIDSIDRSLQGMSNSVARMADAFVDLCQRLAELWLPDNKRRKR